jgi:hypothetical protein
MQCVDIMLYKMKALGMVENVWLMISKTWKALCECSDDEVLKKT